MFDRRLVALLIDDNDVFRIGLRVCLEEREIQVIGETDNPEIAWTLIETHYPDLILLHSCLPPTGGVPFCEQIAHRHPEIKVILTDPDPFTANNLGFAQALRAGACACLPREGLSHQECIAVVQAVLEGRRLFGEEILLRALRLEPLTPREQEVLALMTQGVPNVKIAQALHLAEGTVHNYASRVRVKLGVVDRLEAVLYARRLGLID